MCFVTHKIVYNVAVTSEANSFQVIIILYVSGYCRGWLPVPGKALLPPRWPHPRPPGLERRVGAPQCVQVCQVGKREDKADLWRWRQPEGGEGALLVIDSCCKEWSRSSYRSENWVRSTWRVLTTQTDFLWSAPSLDFPSGVFPCLDIWKWEAATVY